MSNTELLMHAWGFAILAAIMFAQGNNIIGWTFAGLAIILNSVHAIKTY